MGSCMSVTDIEDRIEYHIQNHKWSTAFYVCENKKLSLQTSINSALLSLVENEYNKKDKSWFGIDDKLLHECYKKAMKTISVEAIEKLLNVNNQDTYTIQVDDYRRFMNYGDYDELIYNEIMENPRLCSLSMTDFTFYANNVSKKLINDYKREIEKIPKLDLKTAVVASEPVPAPSVHILPQETTMSTYGSLTSCDEEPFITPTTTIASEPSPREQPSYPLGYPTSLTEAEGWRNPASSYGIYTYGDPYSRSSYEWDEKLS